MVIQQVDLINVQQAAIGRGQDARLEMSLALLDGLFDIERSHHPVLGGRYRQVYKWGSALGGGQDAPRGEAFLAFGAPGGWALRITTEAAVLDNLDMGQKGGQGTGGRGFSGTALATDQDTADASIHRVQNERTFHTFLAYDCSKWVNGRHICSEL